jgi:hypothetical protein
MTPCQNLRLFLFRPYQRFRFDRSFFGVWALTFGFLISWVNGGKAEVDGEGHRWQRIRFPGIEVGVAGAHADFLVLGGNPLHGLRLDILISGGAALPDLFAYREVHARIVRENGAVSLPLNGNPLPPIGGAGTASGSTWSTMGFFPWGENRLTAAWIAVEIGDRVVWLELPYGFDRDPSKALSPSSQLELPMKPVSIPEKDVIQWESVYYDFGEIQNSWRLSLIQSNPFDARAEIVLYREDSAIGKSMFLWDLHTPRTGIRIIESDGGTVKGMCLSLRLQDDGYRRSDTYRFNRNGIPGRSWGEIEVTVGPQSYRMPIPSSMFKYVHGHSRSQK